MLAIIMLFIGFYDEPKATNEDYGLVLAKFGKISEVLFVEESWKDFEIINKKTGKKDKFISLSILEQKTFLIMLAQQTSADAYKMQTAWEHELDLYKNPEYKSTNPKVSKPKEIEEFVRKLLVVRKKLAENMEKFAEQFVKEFEKEIIESESKVLVQKIKQFNDSFNLIERKKR